MAEDASFWDGIAERYSKKPVENVAAFERKKTITKAHMKPTDVVLDVGCCTGTLAIELASHAAKIHALDVSTEMLKIGRRKADAAGVTNLTFHQAALEEALPFEPESFDGICAYSILHLVDDPGAALDKVYKLLKPGGFFISSTVCIGGSWMPPYRIILPVMRWLGKAPFVNLLRADEFMASVEAAGFSDLDAPDVGAKPTTVFLVAKKPDPVAIATSEGCPQSATPPEPSWC